MEVWDIYFASLVAMTLHPGAGTRGHHKLTIEDCAKIADEMMEEREQTRWHGSEQQSSPAHHM